MSASTEERLRRALAESAPTGAGPGCPGPERIWAVSRGEATGEEATRVVDHSLDCAGCAEALQLAREVGAGVDHAARRGRASTVSFATVRWLVAAAVLLVAATVLWRFGVDRSPPDSHFRQPAGTVIESVLADGASLPRDGFVLRWTGVAPGTLHTITIATRELEVIHRAQGIEGTEYTVPPEVLADLPDGATVLWSVEAVTPGADRITSHTYRVELE